MFSPDFSVTEAYGKFKTDAKGLLASFDECKGASIRKAFGDF